MKRVSFVVLAAALTWPSVWCQEISLSFGENYEDVVGLDFSEGLFWVADNYLGFAGAHSRIHLIDPATGVEVGVFDSPVSTHGGARDIVVVGDSIFQPEDNTNLIHRFSKVDGSLIESFSHDGRFPWGIASDQEHLFVLETENPEQIQKRSIDSPDYPFVARFPWPNPRQSGLTYVQGHLYRVLTNTGSNPVQRLDASTGAVLESIPLPQSLVDRLELDVAVVRDLVFDGSHFWFHLRLVPGPDKLVRAPSGWAGICPRDDFEDGDFDRWTLSGIGNANQESAAVVDDEGNLELALTADGATAYYGKDNAGFLYQELISNFRIEADLDTKTMTTGKAWRKAGLMVRASLDHLDIRLLAMVAPVQERLQFVAREVYGGPGNVKLATEIPGAPSAVRLAIERTGQSLSVEYSLDDGATWIRPSTGLGGSIEIADLPEKLLVGLAVVSNNISVTTTALFDDVTICTDD